MIRLKELRSEKGITMKRLGEELGFAESTISLYENGKREPDFSTLLTLSDYFGVSVDYLLGREAKKEPAPRVASGLSEAEHEIIAAYRAASAADRQIIDNIVERYTPAAAARKKDHLA